MISKSKSSKTTTCIVVGIAHCPGFGVKVYSVVAVGLKFGDHVPLTPLFDRFGRITELPKQLGLTGVKVGVRIGFTMMVICVEVAQKLASGVKVYVVVCKLLKAGNQDPVIPLFEVVGRAAKVSPEHISATCVN